MGLRASFRAVVSAVVISSADDMCVGSGGGIVVSVTVLGDRTELRSREGLDGVRRTVGKCSQQEFHLITSCECAVTRSRIRFWRVVDWTRRRIAMRVSLTARSCGSLHRGDRLGPT